MEADFGHEQESQHTGGLGEKAYAANTRSETIPAYTAYR